MQHIQKRYEPGRFLLLLAVLAWVVVALLTSGCSSTQTHAAAEHVPMVLEAAATFTKAVKTHIDGDTSPAEMPIQCSTAWNPDSRTVRLECEGKAHGNEKAKDEGAPSNADGAHEAGARQTPRAREGLPLQEGRRRGQGEVAPEAQDDAAAQAQVSTPYGGGG